MIGGGGGIKVGPSKARQRTAGGFGVAVSPQIGPGRRPKNFQICVGRRITQYPLLFEINTKDMPHMKFIFVETDDEY